jgi:hypothetical protein
MKRKLKAFTFALLCVLIFSVFALGIYADDGDFADAEAEISDTGMGEGDSAPSGAEGGEDNIFASVFAFFEANATEIFSLLSFFGSLFIMITYKSGLLPFVENGIGAIAGGVKKMSERAQDIGKEADAFGEGVKKKLEDTEALLLKMQECVSDLDARLRSADEDSAARERLEAVLHTEIDMLYEIFMAAALPQYLKERVGERVAEMKHALAEAPENEA